MDMTKRLRPVKSLTMVDVKVVLISKNTIFRKKKTFPFQETSTASCQCPSVKIVVRMAAAQELCVFFQGENNAVRINISIFFAGPRGLARIGFQSGTLTTLRNVACLSTMEDVKVEDIFG